ncbi:inositol 2-dehydrogenase [Thermosediminibacter litoriperuensis]|uniref:Myo-inositol 2-dehydrogenase n=1 Tax=Thermosediminibacter litoriperuensis TaxID=291989 RepID=A0A5S5AEE3_9FIRM|nr:inositol 2-dehydrogenase [Thermosediminibacter litoriperuensis]TYP47895.1 myo-inositol 2-dehydrogenase [Thermosediminibacter litoriperuensis]
MRKKIKIGVIGAGRIGKMHVENILSNFRYIEIKAIADIFADNLKEWANELGIKNIYKDHKDLLGDPEIDAVLIFSSTDTHAQMIIESANAGKHIFCEKPIDFDLNRIREALNAVEKANVKFQLGFNRRFDHNFKKVHDMVREGKVGDVHIVKITSRDPEPPPIGYIRGSGGLFFDMTIHDFDMARYLTGSEVTEVFASAAVLVDPAIGEAGDVDTAIITLKFENGALGVIDNSRKAVYGYDQRVEVFGTKGCITAANDTPTNVILSSSVGVIADKPKYFFQERYKEAYIDEMRAFFDCIINDKKPIVTGIDGLEAVLIGIAAQKSLKEGRPIKIER